MTDCPMLPAEPLISMVDLALDRPLTALAAVSAFAVLVEAAFLAGHQVRRRTRGSRTESPSS